MNNLYVVRQTIFLDVWDLPCLSYGKNGFAKDLKISIYIYIYIQI